MSVADKEIHIGVNYKRRDGSMAFMLYNSIAEALELKNLLPEGHYKSAFIIDIEENRITVSKFSYPKDFKGFDADKFEEFTKIAITI